MLSSVMYHIHPLGYESDEAIGRRYNRGTGVLLEGGPFTSHPLVSVYEASHMHSMRVNGKRSHSARPSQSSTSSASNAGIQTLTHAQQHPRAAHGRVAYDFRLRETVRLSVTHTTNLVHLIFRDVGLQPIF